MSEYFEHNPGDHEDPLTGPTWLLGVIGAVLLIVIVLGLTALYYNAQSQIAQERVISVEVRALREHNEQQLARIQGPPRQETRTVGDEERQVNIIPIDQAMQQIVQEYGN